MTTDLNVNQLATQATAALKAINDFYRDYTAAAKRAGSYHNVVRPPQIDDAVMMALLEEIVFWDADAAETLVEMRWQNTPDEPVILGRVRMSDLEFDYASAIGAL